MAMTEQEEISIDSANSTILTGATSASVENSMTNSLAKESVPGKSKGLVAKFASLSLLLKIAIISIIVAAGVLGGYYFGLLFDRMFVPPEETVQPLVTEESNLSILESPVLQDTNENVSNDDNNDEIDSGINSNENSNDDIDTIVDISLQNALLAYREYISVNRLFETDPGYEWSHTIKWSIENVLHAEFIDFDSDGIPELLLIIEHENISGIVVENAELYEIKHSILVLGFNGQVSMIYMDNLLNIPGCGNYYDISASANGIEYLVVNYNDHTDFFYEYLSLREGEFISEVYINYHEATGDLYINGEYVGNVMSDDVGDYIYDATDHLNLTMSYQLPAAYELRDYSEEDINYVKSALLSEIERMLNEIDSAG